MTTRANTAIKYLQMILETVIESKDSFLGGIPSGHVYAVLCSKMTLDTFQSLIAKLQDAKAIKIGSDHLMVVGPKAIEVNTNLKAVLGE